MMRVRGHRPADYAALAESLVLAVGVEAGLRLLSVSALLAWLDRLATLRTGLASRTSYRPEQFAAAVYRLLPFTGTCLRESLVLYGLLRRRGSTPRLCVGVTKDGGALSAHAWIECAGATHGSGQGRYLALRWNRERGPTDV